MARKMRAIARERGREHARRILEIAAEAVQ
jgi:hypothetical protein